MPQDQLDWILGLNPFDMCMLDGAGRNNPEYHETGGNLNYRGGVCNGITGGDDETDIAFMPPAYDKRQQPLALGRAVASPFIVAHAGARRS